MYCSSEQRHTNGPHSAVLCKCYIIAIQSAVSTVILIGSSMKFKWMMSCFVAAIYCWKSQENNRSNITGKIEFTGLFDARCTWFDPTPHETTSEFTFGLRRLRWTCHTCASIFQICQLGWCVGQTLGATNQTDSAQRRRCLTIRHKIHETNSSRFAGVLNIERKCQFNISSKRLQLMPHLTVRPTNKKCSIPFLTQGFTYVAPSVLEEMSKPRTTARSPRRSRYGVHSEHCRITKQTPPHLQTFAPRPSPQDEIMEVQGLPIV